MRRSRLAASFLLLGSLINLARPQEPASAKRPDGKTTPLLVYRPKISGAACPPLAVISHGAGGSENGYVYLAQALSDEGFTAVVMGHRESGLDALKSGVQTDGIRNAVRDLVADKNAEQARLIDGATHMNFAGAGPGANRVEPLVTQTIRAFLADASAHAGTQPPAMQGLTFQLK